MLAAICLLAALHAPAPLARAAALRPLYERAAAAHGVPPRLLERVCAHESRHRTWAIGDHGHAFGLGQVHRDGIPGRRYTRAELLRPDVNADAVAAHLARDLRLCHGRVASALARYQRGHGCAPSGYSRAVMLADVGR